MSSQQPGEQQSDPHMLVSPVYLAGCGDPATISNALYTHRDWGWTATDHGQLFTSPRHDIHIAYLPENLYGGWKITRYHEPLGMPIWSASFSRFTPAEITAAFTRALVECLSSDHPYPWQSGPRDQAALPADVLAERGWRSDNTSRGVCQFSPDGHAYLSQRGFDVDDYAELDGDYQAMWTMYACVDKVNGERWHADFTNRTPLYLVTETVRAFSSTEPVERPASGIPKRNLPYVTTSPSEQKSSEQRRSAALAPTPHTHPTTPAPPVGTTAPGLVPNSFTPAPFRRR